MVWAGSPFAHRVEFSTGLPTGAVVYQLLGNDGSVLIDDSIAPAADALSTVILIPGENNSCALPLFENRTLTWNYTTADGLVSDRLVYRVDKPIPFAAAPAGVRNKLGIEEKELPNDQIDLVSAYADLLELGDPSAYETTGDRNTLLCINAIEALAALSVLAQLQLKIAARESSGTNEFHRYGNVDWERIQSELEMHVSRALALLDTTFDGTGQSIFVFGKITPTPDVITQA